MIRSITFISFFLTIFVLASTSLTASTLIPESLVLRADDKHGIIYTHELKKNQTIYGLSKFFNTDLQRITEANPGVKLDAIKLNQSVNIPINTKMISSERNLSPSKSYIPVFYTVKAKDNLFRVAKVYFDQSIDNVMNINKLKSMELNVGQKLLVGWYEYNPEYKEKLAWTQKGIEVNARIADKQNVTTPQIRNDIGNRTIVHPKQDRPDVPNSEKLVFQKIVSDRNEALPPVDGIPLKEPQKEVVSSTKEPTEAKKVDPAKVVPSELDEVISDEVDESTEDVNIDEEIELVLSADPFENRNGLYVGEYEGKPNIQSEKISAQWNSKSKDKINLFALHTTAKTNSYIEIYNPMLDRMVIAKVVGNIPPKAYKDVELIVSPKVAETLGARDKKFFVKVRFIE